MQSSAYQSEMRKCLRKVAKRAAGRTDLFGIKSNVIRIAQHFLEYEPCLVKALRARQCIHQPERTHAECAFMSSQPILGCKLSIQFISMDKAVGNKFAHCAINSTEHARIPGRDKFDDGHHQVACVERLRLEGLREALLIFVPA